MEDDVGINDSDSTSALIRQAEEMIRQTQMRNQAKTLKPTPIELPQFESRTDGDVQMMQNINQPTQNFEPPTPLFEWEEQRLSEADRARQADRVMQEAEQLLAELREPVAVPSTRKNNARNRNSNPAERPNTSAMDESVIIIGDGDVPAPIGPQLVTHVIDDHDFGDEVIFVNEMPGRQITVVDLSETDCHEPPPNLAQRKRKRAPADVLQEVTPEVPKMQEVFSPKRSNTIACPVCMDTITKVPFSTTCGHLFCEGCIRQSIRLNKKCPMCNSKLGPKQIHPVYLSL